LSAALQASIECGSPDVTGKLLALGGDSYMYYMNVSTIEYAWSTKSSKVMRILDRGIAFPLRMIRWEAGCNRDFDAITLLYLFVD
jgi:hypothetical protein